MVAEIEDLPVIKRDDSHSSPRPIGGLQPGTCSIYVRACRVEDAGMQPYWFGSITSRTARPKWRATTKSWASLDITEVREIGRRFMLLSITGFSLGTGTIFQDDGRLCSSKLLFCTAVTGQARMPAYALNNQLGTPLSPASFIALSLFKADKTAGSDRGSGDKSSLWNGRDLSLWKDSIFVGMQSLIWLAISWSDRRAKPQSISWQTKVLSQERELCQRSTWPHFATG